VILLHKLINNFDEQLRSVRCRKLQFFFKICLLTYCRNTE